MFQKQIMQLEADYGACQTIMSETYNKLKYMKAAIKRSEEPFGALSKAVVDIENKLKAINTELYGDRLKSQLDKENE